MCRANFWELLLFLFVVSVSVAPGESRPYQQENSAESKHESIQSTAENPKASVSTFGSLNTVAPSTEATPEESTSDEAFIQDGAECDYGSSCHSNEEVPKAPSGGHVKNKINTEPVLKLAIASSNLSGHSEVASQLVESLVTDDSGERMTAALDLLGVSEGTSDYYEALDSPSMSSIKTSTAEGEENSTSTQPEATTVHDVVEETKRIRTEDSTISPLKPTENTTPPLPSTSNTTEGAEIQTENNTTLAAPPAEPNGGETTKTVAIEPPPMKTEQPQNIIPATSAAPSSTVEIEETTDTSTSTTPPTKTESDTITKSDATQALPAEPEEKPDPDSITPLPAPSSGTEHCTPADYMGDPPNCSDEQIYDEPDASDTKEITEALDRQATHPPPVNTWEKTPTAPPGEEEDLVLSTTSTKPHVMKAPTTAVPPSARIGKTLQATTVRPEGAFEAVSDLKAEEDPITASLPKPSRAAQMASIEHKNPGPTNITVTIAHTATEETGETQTAMKPYESTTSQPQQQITKATKNPWLKETTFISPKNETIVQLTSVVNITGNMAAFKNVNVFLHVSLSK